jgi:energy-coupling factor transporter ATP-binding protein EcfA2
VIESLIVEDLGPIGWLEWREHGAINVLVGTNDTGKTCLLKLLYALARSVQEYHTASIKDPKARWSEVLAAKLQSVFEPPLWRLGELVRKGQAKLKVDARLQGDRLSFAFGRDTTRQIADSTFDAPPHADLQAIFLPPKEVLSFIQVIEASRERLDLPGFDDTYLDLIRALRTPPPAGRLAGGMADVVRKVEEALGCVVEERDGQWQMRRDRAVFSMSQTAEGIKKIGLITRLVRNRSLRPGSVLFLDEPEANLHPQAIVLLVGVLCTLAASGVQIYAATHSYFFLKELEVQSRGRVPSVPCLSLARSTEAPVVAASAVGDLCVGMPDNEIVEQAVQQYQRDIAASLAPPGANDTEMDEV